MSIVAVKGKGYFIGSQCKSGYNVVRRYKKAEESCDKTDVFEWLGAFKTETAANKYIKVNKLKDTVEIIEYKKPKTP